MRINWRGDEVSRQVRQALEHALTAGGAYMVGAVRAEIRSQNLIDTGFLVNSIDHQRASDLSEQVAAHAHYAVYLEYGTRRMGAKAFMRRSMDDGTNQGNVRKIALAALRSVR